MMHPSFYAHAGNNYDLSHLQPAQVIVTLEQHKAHPELEIQLDVRFSNHCYSTGKPKVEGTPHDFTDHNGWGRWFCPDRYASSLKVPGLVNDIHKKKCHFTGQQQRNWLVIEMEGSKGVIVPFYLVFTMRNNKAVENGLMLDVVSAYEKTEGDNAPHRGSRMDRIAFAMLARKTLIGEKVKRPRRQ